jgi:Flp pilus assembly protein CpaB
MDSRTAVLAASHDIAPGTIITADDLREVSVASDGLALISSDQADQVLDGTVYARVPISADSLVDQSMLTRESPVADGRAIVSVPLNPVLTPGSSLSGGDLVQVVRVSGEQGDGQPKELTQALVVSVASANADDLGSEAGTVTLLVPEEAAADVVDASGAGVAGLVLLERGQPLDVDLEVAE